MADNIREKITFALAKIIRDAKFVASEGPGKEGFVCIIHVYKWVPSNIINGSNLGVLQYSMLQKTASVMVPVCRLWMSPETVMFDKYDGDCVEVPYSDPDCIDIVINRINDCQSSVSSY